ncbi:MAG TPA: hypothetical protein VK540_05030 [Polyangiaceae bacterium]|nr:hypothetical protein [Polyangiaceae bacterium]
MTRAARAASASFARWWPGLAAALTAGCLLTTSLDGLEGPPLLPEGGAPEGGGSEAGSEGGPDASAEGGADTEAGGGSNDDGSAVDDRTLLDGTADTGDGAKGPFPVVTKIGGVLRGIATHDTDIYWVQSDLSAGIVHAPKTGGTPMFFHVTPYAFDVAVDADYVYWSTGKGAFGNEVFRKPLRSTVPSSEVVLFPGARETLYLALGTAGRIFVTGGDAVTVGSSVDAGTSYVMYMEQPGAAGIAVGSTNLFWSVTAGIVRGVETGPPPLEPIYTAGMPGEVGGIATDDQEIYWIASDGAVRALALNNPVAVPPREVCRATGAISDASVDARPDDAGNAAVTDIAIDDQWVYFTEPFIGQISKCLKR